VSASRQALSNEAHVTRTTLEGIVGAEWVHDPPVDAFIDGSRAECMVSPASALETADVLRCASEHGWGVIPMGSGSAFCIGNPPRKSDILLSTRRMSEITGYEPAELTTTVGAGCTLSALNTCLSNHGQFLPWDPPGGDARTIGGVASVGRVGPLRMGFGQPRDWVTGLEAVLPDGTVIGVGGRVVKNVAGYDVTRLLVGSHGSLGVITSLGVKVRARPQTELTAVVRSANRTALWNLTGLFESRYVTPVALELLSADAARWAGIQVIGRSDMLCVRVAGEEADVRAQMLTLEQLAAEVGVEITQQIGPEHTSSFWGGVTDLPIHSDAAISLRLSVLPSHIADVTEKAREELSASMEEFAYRAGPSTGTLYVLLGGVMSETRGEEVATSIERLRDVCRTSGGSLIVEKAPIEVKNRVDVWGQVGSSEELMRATKRLFDPNSTLNPGRFVAGI
jgi:glycolate oxidase FAD binding subunit